MKSRAVAAIRQLNGGKNSIQPAHPSAWMMTEPLRVVLIRVEPIVPHFLREGALHQRVDLGDIFSCHAVVLLS